MYAHRYKPYKSDSEDTDTETENEDTDESSNVVTSSSDSSESDNSDSEDETQLPNQEGFQTADFKTLADGLAKPPTSDSIQDSTDISTMSDTAIGSDITASGTIKPPPPVNALPPVAKADEILESSSQSITNVVMIDSRDRDLAAYPQPTNLTLRLPRTYKNVTGFTMLQIKLLSAFYYFSVIKQNISLSILEIGRTIPGPNGSTIDNVIVNTIRQGTYDINSLITELTTQINRTPIFYDFINGFQDFATIFAVTGDFSLNFNYPGDTYYDALLKQFIPNPTMSLIISKYFINQYANLPTYSVNQIKIAYYYPVLKEAVLDPEYTSQINYTLNLTSDDLLPTETAFSRIVYTFQGINDPVILELVDSNIDLLTTYRLTHTFRYTLINKYVITYQQQSNQIVMSSPSLNTSLLSLIANKKAQFFAESLAYNGFTQAQYNALVTQNNILLSVINDMVNFYQTQLAIYFGVQYNTYSRDYLLNSTYSIAIRDAYNAQGISSNYNPYQVMPAIVTNIVDTFRSDAPQYWNRMTGLTESTIAYMNPIVHGDNPSGALNYNIWNNDIDQQDSEYTFVLPNVLDSNNLNTTSVGNLYINKRTQYSDVIIPTKSSKYTAFRFKSPVRQTLRIETLSRPTKYRYPAYNAVTYDTNIQTLFDASYCFVPPIPAVDVSSNTFNFTQIQGIPGFSTPQQVASFGSDFSTSVSYWSSNSITLSVAQPRSYTTFYSPYPPNYDTLGAPAYTYPLTISLTETSSTGFITPMYCFLYEDRSAFMADISGNGNENPLHYIYSTSTIVGQARIDLNFKTYAGKQYYMLLRPIFTSFATDTFRIVPWFPSSMYFTALTSTLVGFDPLADPILNLSNYNYASLADPAFIQVPIASTLYKPPVLDITFSSLTFSTSLMGYDISGVSTDLTNYIGYIPNVVGSNSVPNSQIHIDPTNGFIFQYRSPYNVSTAQYFSAGTSNSILYNNGSAVYSTTTIAVRQKSIVNWYGNVFIPPSMNQLEIDPSVIAPSIEPYTQTYPLVNGVSGYNYYTRYDINGDPYLNTSNLISLGDGIMGIGFVPEQGVWNIDQFMFKSIYNDSNTDVNLNIKYIGIFPAAAAYNQKLFNLQLSNAVATLEFTSSITYNSSNLNFGFDVGEGTYYEFKQGATGNIGSNAYLYGYTQSSYEYNFDINAQYIAVPFTASSNISYYSGLVGSAVPYPFYNSAVAVSSISSPDGPLSPPTGTYFVVPNGVLTDAPSTLGPPTGFTATESKYEQSMTSVTNLIMYANTFQNITATQAFKPATTPFTYNPTSIVADCAGFIMTYDTIFRVYSYPFNTSSITLQEAHVFTLDQIFPISSNIAYLATAANETKYAFFGLSNADMYIRTFDPTTGLIEDGRVEPSPFAFQSNAQLYKATYNNLGGYTLSAKLYDSDTNTSHVEVISKANSNTINYTRLTTTFSNVNDLIIQQSPKELYGRFWAFPYRNSLNGINDFIYVDPNQSSETPTSVDYTALIYPSNRYASIKQYTLSNIYINPIVTRAVEEEQIYFLKTGTANFYVAPMNSPTPNVKTSVYMFPSIPDKILAGANGSMWGNVGTTLYGNRNDLIDAPTTASAAWQIFNPVQRIVFHQISKNFSLLLDLSGRKYPEYPHTALAVYDSSGNFRNDTNGKWGLELSGNFVTADFNTSGYYFNAYDYIVPLKDNRSSNDFYYMSIRNYFPTEESQVTLRISAPNKYTFGYVTATDLSGEISTATKIVETKDPLYSRYWDPNYTRSLLGFNSNFIIGSAGKIFGAGVVTGFPGSNISNVSSFGDFYSRIQSIYSTYTSQTTLVSTINTQAVDSLNNYITNDLQYIIPASAQNRQRITDPLRFSILWKSALSPNYAALEDNWGLGWNLGYSKVDTPFATVQIAPSFFKLIDDFIRLRLNQEFDMNRIDTISKENLSVTLDSTGQTKTYYGKLLLANFGSYAQTLISNPIAFLNPLGKLDKLTFQWLDATNAIINNNDCEWNAVVQITEKVDIAMPKKDATFNQTLYS
jgi:hypothetical protein